METIENRIFRSETVYLDNKLFVSCTFENCLLVYAGDPCEWENSRFSGCRLSLEGSAARVVQVLLVLGVSFPQASNPVRFP